MISVIESMIGNYPEFEVFYVITGCLVFLYAVRAVIMLFSMVIKMFGN